MQSEGALLEISNVLGYFTGFRASDGKMVSFKKILTLEFMITTMFKMIYTNS